METNLPVSGQWYKRTAISLSKSHRLIRRSKLYQCMKVGGPFLHEFERILNPNPVARRRKGRRYISKRIDPPIPNVRSIILRTPHNTKKRTGWNNLHVYSSDWPVFNNPNPTPKDPISMIIFTPVDPPPDVFVVPKI